ncbi:hypothetical protein COCNU_06G005680 [Cocos nucifera]|uniref:Uncharacterized protein n=1 Tax=Cocos nucifera TaxID=13894 RepID=A0A8K0IAP5_COCNU|nr:hypothetical protein COCNU_06G005680 [Cocos nucifera]
MDRILVDDDRFNRVDYMHINYISFSTKRILLVGFSSPYINEERFQKLRIVIAASEKALATD